MSVGNRCSITIPLGKESGSLVCECIPENLHLFLDSGSWGIMLAIVVLAIVVLEQNLMHLRKQEGSRKKQRGGKFNDGVRDKRNG